MGGTLSQTGGLEESLKWGQPSYSTVNKVGSPFRIARFEQDKVALFFHCQTSLVEHFRVLFSDPCNFQGTAPLSLIPDQELPINELALCIEAFLTYHLRKKR